MIPLKSKQDLGMMRTSGKILAKVMLNLQDFIKAGIRTAEIDRLVDELLRRENAMPAFKGYKGFPANVCTSINEEVVHGIPGSRRIEKSNDTGAHAARTGTCASSMLQSLVWMRSKPAA